MEEKINRYSRSITPRISAKLKTISKAPAIRVWSSTLALRLPWKGAIKLRKITLLTTSQMNLRNHRVSHRYRPSSNRITSLIKVLNNYNQYNQAIKIKYKWDQSNPNSSKMKILTTKTASATVRTLNSGKVALHNNWMLKSKAAGQRCPLKCKFRSLQSRG